MRLKIVAQKTQRRRDCGEWRRSASTFSTEQRRQQCRCRWRCARWLPPACIRIKARLFLQGTARNVVCRRAAKHRWQHSRGATRACDGSNIAACCRRRRVLNSNSDSRRRAVEASTARAATATDRIGDTAATRRAGAVTSRARSSRSNRSRLKKNRRARRRASSIRRSSSKPRQSLPPARAETRCQCSSSSSSSSSSNNRI